MKARKAEEFIAEALGETGEKPLDQIAQVVEVLGEKHALSLLDEALEVEKEGGLNVPDGTRRRTPGGVFFHLLRQQLPREAKQRIFYGKGRLPPKPKPAPKPVAKKEQAHKGGGSRPPRRRRVFDVEVVFKR